MLRYGLYIGSYGSWKVRRNSVRFSFTLSYGLHVQVCTIGPMEVGFRGWARGVGRDSRGVILSFLELLIQGLMCKVMVGFLQIRSRGLYVRV